MSSREPTGEKERNGQALSFMSQRGWEGTALGPDNYDAPCVVMHCITLWSAMECLYDSDPIRFVELKIPITW